MSGTLTDPTGGSVRGLVVHLHSTGVPGIGATIATADEEGRFSFRGVVSGSYFVSVSVPRGKAPPLPGGPCGSLQRASWSSTTTSRILNCARRRRGACLGRIERDIGATASFNASATGVGFVRHQAGGGSFDGFGRKPEPDGLLGEFDVAGGPVFVEVEVPAGWMVKAIRVDGGDASEGPVDFGGGRHELEVRS